MSGGIRAGGIYAGDIRNSLNPARRKKPPSICTTRITSRGVKLYVKRVFITDDDKELMPTWLRFVRGSSIPKTCP
jgi:hypothetical protein